MLALEATFVVGVAYLLMELLWAWYFYMRCALFHVQQFEDWLQGMAVFSPA